MATKVGSLLTHWEQHEIVEFTGPKDFGLRACLQVGDSLKLTRSDARELVRIVERWLAEKYAESQGKLPGVS